MDNCNEFEWTLSSVNLPIESGYYLVLLHGAYFPRVMFYDPKFEIFSDEELPSWKASRTDYWMFLPKRPF